MDTKTKEKRKGKIVKLVVKIIVLIILISVISTCTSFFVKQYLENSEETAKYKAVYEVISNLEDYQGDCSEKQGEELIDLLIKKINKYSTDIDKRVTNIKVTYYTDAVKKDETIIEYTGSINDYTGALENVKTRIAGSNKIHVIYQYNDQGYIISCNMYIYTMTALQNIAPDNLVEFSPYVPPETTTDVDWNTFPNFYNLTNTQTIVNGVIVEKGN